MPNSHSSSPRPVQMRTTQLLGEERLTGSEHLCAGIGQQWSCSC